MGILLAILSVLLLIVGFVNFVVTSAHGFSLYIICAVSIIEWIVSYNILAINENAIGMQFFIGLATFVWCYGGNALIFLFIYSFIVKPTEIRNMYDDENVYKAVIDKYPILKFTYVHLLYKKNLIKWDMSSKWTFL